VSGVVATVFGATGFVGRYVVDRLGKLGSQVIVPYRGDGMNARHLKLLGDYGQIVLLPYHMTDEASVQRAVSRSNVVINLIGSQYETKNYNFHDAHVRCSYRIAKAAKAANVKRFIQMSTVCADVNHSSKWISTKAEAENAVREFFPDATILRSCPIYGLQDKFLNRYAELCNTFPFVPLVDGGKQKLQPVYAIDVANAILASIEQEETMGQIIEMGGPRVMTTAQIVELILHEIVRPSNTIDVPISIANAYGAVLENLPRRWRLLTRDLVAQMKTDLVVNKREGIMTLEDLGVTPHSLQSTVPSVMLRHRGSRIPPGAPERNPLTDE